MSEAVEASSVEPAKSASAPQRDMFATKLGVLLATLGSAVGLGNIWKFPYLTGSNGGAAFLIIYILCTLVIGLPIMVTEHVIGRTGRGDAVASIRKVTSKKSIWWLIGASGILSAFLIMAFYTEVAAWVLAYIVKAISGGLLSTSAEVNTAAFTSLVTNPTLSLIWQWIDLAIVGIIIWLGVSKGIEATTKRLMPILFLMLVAVGIRSLTLPGAAEGLKFLFQPDFSKITGTTFLVAMGLAFFKLSIGMGCMITYGSYFRNDQNIPVTATRVVFSDLAVSLLAGIAIFPAVFAFGFKPDAGASLLFITIPAVFAKMPLGNIFVVVFFILTFFASVGAQLSLIEVIVSFLQSTIKLDRTKSSIATIVALALFGSLAALSNSTLANFKLFGLTPFDLFDFVSSNILQPVGGLFLAIFVGWAWGRKNFQAALSNDGALANQRITNVIFFILRFITPVLVLIVLLNGLKLI
ncbi:MAG: sodium-dependent transporter [Anaerolineaceae bacterium]